MPRSRGARPHQREPALILRYIAALLAAAAGALIGAGVMVMVLGILFTMIGGSFEGSAAMGGVTVGVPLGGILGFLLLLGGWLVLRFWRPEKASG